MYVRQDCPLHPSFRLVLFARTRNIFAGSSVSELPAVASYLAPPSVIFSFDPFCTHVSGCKATDQGDAFRLGFTVSACRNDIQVFKEQGHLDGSDAAPVRSGDLDGPLMVRCSTVSLQRAIHRKLYTSQRRTVLPGSLPRIPVYRIRRYGSSLRQSRPG